VTGTPEGLQSEHHRLGLILGIVFGVIGGLILLVAAALWYRKRRRRRTGYHNLEDVQPEPRPRSWSWSWRRPPAQPSPHLRGGGESVDTLHSLLRSEPYILPPPVVRRPMMATPSDNRNSRAILDDFPYVRDVSGASILGVHGESRPAMREVKSAIGPHGRPPSRTPSGREALARPTGRPPPLTIEPPVRVARDSEDFSPALDEPELTNPLLYDPDAIIEVPPTYHSLTAQRLTRSNAIRTNSGGRIRTLATIARSYTDRAEDGHGSESRERLVTPTASQGNTDRATDGHSEGSSD